MGWFDGWFGSGSSGSDPLRRLDPKLREFLERESPVKHSSSSTTTTPEQQPPQSQPQQRAHQQQNQSAQRTPAAPPDTQPPSAPSESLFPDGRYAHLWKTYRPLSAIEAETKTDSEKLSDVLEAFKERKALIGRAALENCADEQFTWAECMKSGSWTARMTMCRAEVQRFERCYSAQSRLLKALGYLSVQGRSAAVDEEIQMRADELYHRMMAQERETERAREEGRDVPVYRPLFEEETEKRKKQNNEGGLAAAELSAAGSGGVPVGVPEPNAATLAAWKERLEKLPPEEREAEEQALRAEHRAKAEMTAKIHGLWQEQAKERQARKAEGKETFLDKFSALFGAWSGPKSG